MTTPQTTLELTRPRPRRHAWMLAPLAILLLAAPAASAQGTALTDACQSKTVQHAVTNVQRAALRIVELSLTPGTTPSDWVNEFEELMADQTMVLGLCNEARVIDRGCPFCAESDLPLTIETAPVHLLRWMLKSPELLDPRLRPEPAAQMPPIRTLQTTRERRDRRGRRAR